MPGAVRKFRIQHSALSKEDATRVAKSRRAQGKIGVRVVKSGGKWAVGWKDY
jgi:hypothetical protein